MVDLAVYIIIKMTFAIKTIAIFSEQCLLLETCWPTDDNYQKIAIHIRFKLPSRKMYFIVHFSFDTQTFGFQYSSNMENNKKV